MGRKQEEGVSRRKFLEFGTGAVAATAGLLSLSEIAAGQSTQQEVKTGKATTLSDPGPTDKALDSANPDSNIPPLSDGGGVPSFKFHERS